MKTLTSTAILAITTALSGMVPAQTALAQDTGTETGQSATDESAFDEIVVTAQRRSERLLDVPVSITAISADAVRPGGLTDLDSLTRAAPGVVINRLGAYLQPTIRGIGSNVTGVAADAAVGIYVDGVYQPSSTGAFFDLPNVEQIEILKGPQGTLFGRNSTGGAILIRTFDPSFVPSGKFGAAYGNMNEYSLHGYVNVPLSDTVAANLSAYYRHTDGWMRDMKTGADRNRQHSGNIRGKLLFQPSDAFRLVVTGSYDDTSDPTGNMPTAWRGNTSASTLPGAAPIATRRGDYSADYPSAVQTKAWELSARASLDLGFATVATITAYRSEDGFIRADLDATYARALDAIYDQNVRTFSQEVTLTSPDDEPLKWVVGLYYFRNHGYYPGGFFLNRAPSYNADEYARAFAGFADATYKLGKLSIFAGLRYSSERKEHNFGAGLGPQTVHAARTFSQLSPRAGLIYALDDHANVYASYNRGFKSGIYNQGSASTVPVKDETVDAFEVGFKTSGRALSLNLAGFYNLYKNIQVNAFDYAQGTSRLINAATAKIHGAEVELITAPAPGLQLRASAAYVDAKYDKFPGALLFIPRPGGTTGNTTVVGDASDTRMLRAPKLTLSGTISYTAQIGDGDLKFSLTPYYSSKINYSLDERVQQKAYATLDGTIGWSPNAALAFTIYGRNLFDKTYASFMSAASNRDTIIYARPRTYGISVAYRY